MRINYEVKVNSSLTKPEVFETPLLFGDKITKWKVIYNGDGHIYNVVRNSYALIKHQQVERKLEEKLAEFKTFGEYKTKEYLVKSGGFWRKEYQYLEYPIEIENEVFYPNIIVENSYDGTSALRILLGILRKVCANGMVIGEKIDRIYIKHIYNADTKFIFEIEKKIKDFLTLKLEEFIKLKEKKMTLDEIRQTIKEIGFCERRKKEIEKLPETATGEVIRDGLSMWLVYCILSQYITHHLKIMQRRMYEERLRRVMALRRA